MRFLAVARNDRIGRVVISRVPPFAVRRVIIGKNLHCGIARTNHSIVRAAQAARGRGIRFGKPVKYLLSLRDPDDRVVRATFLSGCSIAFIETECPVSWKHGVKSHETASSPWLLERLLSSGIFKTSRPTDPCLRCIP